MKIGVVGCGIIGLTSAIALLEEGHQVEVVGRELPLETTSAVAAALWFPFLAEPRARVLKWSQRTLAVYSAQAADPETGIRWIENHEFYEQASDEQPWWCEAIAEARRLQSSERPAGYADGWAARVPVIESTRYLVWLVKRLEQLGGSLERKALHDLTKWEGGCDLILNCSGLGARELAKDEGVYPIRGQIAVVACPGLTRGAAADEGPLGLGYVIPRTEDAVLGGTAEPGNHSLQPDPQTTARILANARILAPQTAGAPLLRVRVGLRPGRANVRLEWEPTAPFRLLHNYGHGGSGFTLAWGCAEECRNLVRQIRLAGAFALRSVESPELCSETE